MRASIIIAAHQEGALLGKTIETCLRTCSDFEREIIVADDASTDGSIDDAIARFPEIKIVRHDVRRGTSPTKDLGARRATGDVLVFLDAHTNPEPGAVLRLVEDVELLDYGAIVTPAIPRLCAKTWRNLDSGTGHGYSLDLQTFDCGWLPLERLRKVERAGRTFYESPALIGCSLAIGRELYDRLSGFDPAMRLWGVEDLDFALKCWLMGYAVLHDPAAVVGHRFQEAFSSYRVSALQVLVSRIRMAYKNLSLSTWPEWLRLCRERHSEWRPEQPEGVFAAGWHEFELGRDSAERERVYLAARRAHDDLWYADRFGLRWPRLATRPPVALPAPLPIVALDASDTIDPSPPPCQVAGIQFFCDGEPADASDPMYVLVGTPVTFQVVPASPNYPCADASVAWGGTSGTSGAGTSTTVNFNTLSESSTDYKTVTATCGNSATVNVVVFDLIGKLTPADNFAGRSQTEYGLLEDVNLAYSTVPEGLTSAQIGRLQWNLRSGVGSLPSRDDAGAAVFNAGSAIGNATLQLRLLDCPSNGLGPLFRRMVVAPEGGSVVRVPGSGIWHCANTFSIGMNSNFYLFPKSVSFSGLFFKEGAVVGQASGWFIDAGFDGKVHPEWPVYVRVGSGNINTGCQVLMPAGDIAAAEDYDPPPYKDGTFLWAIPWLYSADQGATFQKFTFVNQTFTASKIGDATVEKADAGPFGNNHADPSANIGTAPNPYPCP